MMLAAGVPLVPVALHGDPAVPLADGTRVRILQPDLQKEPPATARNPGKPALAGQALPGRDWLSLWRHRKLLATMEAVARELKATHLHASWCDLPGLLTATAARHLGLSYSLDAHAQDIHGNKYPPERLFGQARFIAVCNRCAQEKLRALLPASCSVPVHYLPHGLRLGDWPAAPPLPWNPGRPLRLLFAGRLIEKKGVDCLIPAMAALRQEDGIKTHLTLLGEGPLQPLLQQQAAELGLAEAVSFAGVVERQQLRDYFRLTHLLLFPGRRDASGDQDGIPNVILEAMASGLPVVATQAGGIGEVVDPTTAYVAEAAEPAALAAALRQFCAQGEMTALRKTLAARTLVETNFNAEKLIWRKIDLLTEG